MRKLFTLMMFLAIGSFTVGCGGPPASVEDVDPTEQEMEENTGAAAGGEIQIDVPGDAAPPEGGDAAPAQ